MADTEERTSKLLMAWYLCFNPRAAAQQIKIGDERSFTGALAFAAWCVGGSLGIAAAIAGKNAEGATTFLWQEVGIVGLAGNWLILYPFLRPFSWKALSFRSSAHVYCYYLMFGVLKLVAFYVGQYVQIVLLLVPLIDIWGLFVLAFLLKNVLHLQYWKFVSAFVIATLAIGVFLAVLAPSLLHQLTS